MQEEQTQFVYSESSIEHVENYMDRWIVSFTQSLVMFVRQEMQGGFYCCLLKPRLKMMLSFSSALTELFI